MPAHVLTINSGSSSIKFALFAAGAVPQRVLHGQLERIGLPQARLRVAASSGELATDEVVPAVDHQEAVGRILDWLSRTVDVDSIAAVGHRVVHGGDRCTQSTRIDDDVLRHLREIIPLAPNHLPGEIAALEAVQRRCPGMAQYACFDTAFHHELPVVARVLPLPRQCREMGLRRYGFHGLSYAYLLRALSREAGPAAAQGRVILAHLGAGCSLAAVQGGRCIDTTMSFTPTAGLVMATRTGDLDPGVLIHLLRTQELSADALERLVNRESGLIGLSETSSDVRDLLACEDREPRAKLALDVFCYQARKWIGALAAALEGLDVIVFSAGIGENSPTIRTRICKRLRHLGVALDEQRNGRNDSLISAPEATVAVRVIPTDEESMIAADVAELAGVPRAN
ncbi:MAG: acetate/propionate family kinase [Planctomyces sp.]|nr:acetate/propionate family kinase [Planctomyces sp.]